MKEFTRLRDIGSVIADEVSPSFDVFRFKANANEYVYPGTLVGTTINNRAFLIGRIAASIEVNPHESAARVKVREAMFIEADYPKEELSTNIYRVYEADIIEEGIISTEGDQHQLEITDPSDMAKAGEAVFIPSAEVIAKAMGFEREAEEALCLGRTRITAEDILSRERETSNNVLLKPEVIQRHIFIGGTTGSGKSFATEIVLEELNKFNVPIVILDSQHEYEGVATDLGGVILRPGRDYTVRLSSLTEAEILDLVPTLRAGTHGHDLLAFSFLGLRREILERRRTVFGLMELLDRMRSDAPTLDIKEEGA
jgi:DNA helicase HerA-like ATPase